MQPAVPPVPPEEIAGLGAGDGMGVGGLFGGGGGGVSAAGGESVAGGDRVAGGRKGGGGTACMCAYTIIHACLGAKIAAYYLMNAVKFEVNIPNKFSRFNGSAVICTVQTGSKENVQSAMLSRRL